LPIASYAQSGLPKKRKKNINHKFTSCQFLLLKLFVFGGPVSIFFPQDAMSFAIIEESSISKGTRRIVAVTRDVAANALAEALALEQRVIQAEQQHPLSTTVDLQQLGTDIDANTIPLVAKIQLKGRLQALTKKAWSETKANLSNERDVIRAKITSVLGGNPSVLVLSLENASGNSVKVALTEAKILAPSLPTLVVANVDGGLICSAHVPMDWVVKGLLASNWVQHVVSARSGKGGGKDISAQGKAAIAGDLMELISVANQYVANIGQ
jgi:alanyl-tRNA synthetase